MWQMLSVNMSRIMILISFSVSVALSPLFSDLAGAASIQIDVNYRNNWIAGVTDPDAILAVQLMDSTGVLKDQSNLTAETDGSFLVDECPDWASGSCPDITVGDSVLVDVLSAPSTQALVDSIGQISAIPDAAEDTVSGVINAPYTEPLTLQCMVWEKGGATLTGLVDPQGGSYTCDFGGTWDLQKGQHIAVAYLQPDGNRVINIVTWPCGSVNYAQDTVALNYDAGHTFSVTVSDSGGAVKAMATTVSQLNGGWDGDGFEVSELQWSPAVPDIIQGDRVSFVADNGYSKQITIGTITGDIDVAANGISGTINAPEFTDLASLPFECHPRGAWDMGLNDVPVKESTVAPDGSDSYGCTWDEATEWDLLPGQTIAVMYVEPDDDKIINTFTDPAPHLVLEDFHAMGIAGEGGNLAFSIRAANRGVAAAEDSTITVTLQNITYLADTCGFSIAITTVPEGQQMTWDLGTLAEGISLSCQIFVSVDGLASEDLSAAALVETSNPDDQSKVSEKQKVWLGQIEPNSVNLTISKHSRTPDPAPGTDFVWEVDVCNSGNTSSSEITLIETFPPASVISFVNWKAADPGWQEAEVTSNQISLTLPTLPNGSCRRTYWRFHVSEEALFDTSIINTVEASEPGDPENPEDPPGGAWALDELFISEPRANLTIRKDWQNGQLTPGGNLHYLIHISNTGNIPFDGYQEPDGDQIILAIIDTLPVDTSFVEARLVSGGVSSPLIPLKVNGGMVVLQLPGLENGYEGLFEVDARVNLDALPETLLLNSAQICLFNTVTEECVTGPVPEDSYEDNISQDTQNVYDHGPNLRISKRHEWLSEQKMLKYQIRFENVGNVSVSNIQIKDTYPFGTTFNGEYEIELGEDLSNFSHTPGQIIWSFESFEPGQVGMIHYTLTLNDPTNVPEYYTNIVEIFLSEDVYPSDNTYEDTAIRRDLGSVHLKLDEQALLGTAIPGKTVTVTTPQGQFLTGSWDCAAGHFYPDDISLGGCWAASVGNIVPGYLVQVVTDQHQVNIEIPDLFVANASSISNTVYGQIDNLDTETVNIRVGLGDEIVGETVVETDSAGQYMAAFGNIPTSCWAEAIYKTAVNYANVVFHRRVTCDYGDINGDGNVDLKDVINGLQVVTGSFPPELGTIGDVNADDRIGLEEVLYDLREVSE